ncbi:MAG TPA: radical SAM protein, partial [Nitrospiraceae bacterium]|nr:radical SAM protein [Nitrospiraceae bacterium]
MPNIHILFTTVCRPFGGNGEGDSVGAELFHAQVTREQGIFSYRQVIRCWGLDYIAENINVPSVVLHYPSEREFVRELRNRKHDYIGINFVVATFHKLKRMTELIRSHAPKAKIILGGYGTVLSDEELSPYGDLICREEGIGFMRRLLGEDPERPIVHPYAPIESPRIYSYPLKTKVAHITGGLGCPNGCDFCCTSHFFKRRYIPFVKSGQELYRLILDMEKQAEKAGDVLSGFILIDEDFFLH